MLTSRLLCAALVAFPAYVLGDSKFTQPGIAGATGDFSHNPTYDVGDRMEIEWESDLEYMDIILYQAYPKLSNGNSYVKNIKAKTRSTSMIWTVSTNGFSTDTANNSDAVFYLTLYEFGVNKIVTSSHYFNVTLDSAAASTEAATQTTMSATAAVASSTIESSGPSATETTTQSPESTSDESESSGLSTGAVAGVAVGATAGGIAALAGLGFLLWKRSRRGKDAPSSPQSEQGQTSAQSMSQKYAQELPYTATPHQELPVGPTPHELTSDTHTYARSPGGIHEAP